MAQIDENLRCIFYFILFEFVLLADDTNLFISGDNLSNLSEDINDDMNLLF